MPDLLLEVGTEELPSGAIASAIDQFKDALVSRLESERLPVSPDNVRTFATPRRLTVRIHDLPERQPDAAVEARGPQARAAFDAEGKPTRAAEGFARKQGVPVESLTVEGDYVVARRTEPGRTTAEVVAAAIPDLLKALNFPKFMRWGAGNYRFGRPLRRFVALLDGDVIPFAVEGIASGNVTIGHRDLGGPVTIEVPDAYESALRSVFVEPDPTARHTKIVTQARLLAEEIGGTAVLDSGLVDENVYLTEWVTAVRGAFDPAYLALPRPVLVTAMKKHQRFFPVEGPDGNLLPNFIAVRNGSGEYVDTVRTGYEKVLASRFSDAKFFFDHDRESPLSAKLFKTEKIVFQEKLGTLADKSRRLLALMEKTGLAEWTGDADAARRAVQLAKADLASEIVAELPALQGVMGREFARMDSEPESVAEALYEQYLPRFAGDALPESKIGTALSLIDRVDTLVGYMLFVGAEPRGSSDPFGLKRAASAIVDLLARDAGLPSVPALLEAAKEAYVAQGLEPAAKPGNVAGLLAGRLSGLLEERGIRYDLIDSLLAVPWDDIASVVARADALTRMLEADTFVPTVQVAVRVRNILRAAGETSTEFDTSLLDLPEEKSVLAALAALGGQAEQAFDVGDLTGAFAILGALNEPINRFFDSVLVNAEDPALRRARLGLLARADRLYLKLADFSKLVME